MGVSRRCLRDSSSSGPRSPGGKGQAHPSLWPMGAGHIGMQPGGISWLETIGNAGSVGESALCLGRPMWITAFQNRKVGMTLQGISRCCAGHAMERRPGESNCLDNGASGLRYEAIPDFQAISTPFLSGGLLRASQRISNFQPLIGATGSPKQKI